MSIIAARDANGVIGQNGRMPWHLPADLRHFRRLTMGKPLIMGRRTCESLGRPLPGRRNLVLSRAPGFRAASGFECLRSLPQALAAAGDAPEICIIGGAQLYRQCLPLAARIYLTVIEHTFPGDTLFPPLDERSWIETERQECRADANNPWPYRFTLLERRGVRSNAGHAAPA